ncbi:tap42 family protein [Cystoisospora suis]|uniref:Tap42 family protein n=1 Tax=Cystoisospora suis TaxID=483139 RepID=A0A2C6KFT3_9APIC|nr:tap42 family protein [Cystoisospora suis]
MPTSGFSSGDSSADSLAVSETHALDRLFDFAFSNYRRFVDCFCARNDEDFDAFSTTLGSSDSGSAGSLVTVHGDGEQLRLPTDLILQLHGEESLKEVQRGSDLLREELTHKEAYAHQDTLLKLSVCFKACAQAVEKQSLISSNDDWDEVSTRNLKYLLLPYLLGRVSLEFSSSSERRLVALKEAQIFFRAFMMDMERLGVCRAEEVRAFDMAVEELQQEGNGAPPMNQGMPLSAVRARRVDPAARRDELISRAKFEKQADAAITALLKRRRNMALREEAQHEDTGPGGLDEEDERDLWKSVLSKAAADAVTQMELVARELPLLRMHLKNRSQSGPGDGSEARDRRIRAEEASAAPPTKKPWVYTIKDRSDLRNLYRDKVFTPGHNLPTMSLAECAAIEMEMEVNQIGAPKTKVVEEYATAQSRIEREDEKERQERAWDDWKDDNPRGSGNKMRNKG